ncbi:interferon gamma related [Brachyhypopomus gauderio]|uniref:interferon gamma related n=1 Tax=Brachyhypopomus gauderio TaxID=698409 RepID=UPI0040424B51
MDSYFGLLLTCGLIVASLTETAGRSLNVDNDVKAVLKHYKLTGPEWVGKAVFSPYLGKVDDSCTCEKLVLLSMLNVYTDIFSDMMTKSNDKKTDLENLKKNVTFLKASRYTKEQSVWQQLRDIEAIEVTNSTIQGGALNNFLSVYDAASRAGQQMKKT